MANNTSVPLYNFRPYLLVEFSSAIYLSLLSPITVGANGLLLVSIYKDPLKCFRTPVTYFIVGLAIVDLLTGLTVEPFFAVYYFTRYFKGIPNTAPNIKKLYNLAANISTIGLSSSFLIVLALSCSQFIAINFPHKYKTLITTRRVLVFTVSSIFYFTAISLMRLGRYIPEKMFYKINLGLHATSISVLLMIAHGLVLFSFYRHTMKVNIQENEAFNMDQATNHSENGITEEGRNENENRRNSSKHLRQITVVTLMLSAVLLLCSLPHVIVSYLFLYRYNKLKSLREIININIALRITDDVLFLKVLLDPFIYCWRLPKYRNALKRTLLSLHGHS